MKSLIVGVALVTFTQVVSTVTAEELIRFQPAKYARGELRYVSGVPVLLVQGSPNEIGEQVGTLLLKQMGDIKKLVAHYFGENYVESVASILGSLLVQQFPPDHLTEMDAAAKSAEWSRDLLILGNIAIDLRKGPLCSSIIVEPERSKSRQLLLGKNLDWGSKMPLHQLTLVTVYRPTGKHAFASIGFAGMIGCASGINDAGLVVTANSVTEAGDKSALFDPFGTPTGYDTSKGLGRMRYDRWCGRIGAFVASDNSSELYYLRQAARRSL